LFSVFCYQLRYRWLQFGLPVLLFVFLFPLQLHASVEKLTYLDGIKSSKFDEFSKGLDALAESSPKLSSFENDYFQLLMAYKVSYLGDVDKALEMLQPLISNSDIALSFRAKALSINSLILVRRYLDAFLYFEQLINQLPQVNQPAAREQGLRVITMMYIMIERYDLSVAYLDQLIAENPSENSVCAAYQLRMDAWFYSGQFDFIKRDGDAGLQYCEEHNEPLWGKLIVITKAKMLTKEGHYQQSNQLLLKAYEGAVTTKYLKLIAEFNAVLAENFLMLGNYQEAKQYAQMVIAEAASLKHFYPTVQTYQVLYQVAKHDKDYQQALNFHEQYMTAYTAYMDDKSAQQMAYHTARSEILAQNQKIALLDKDNQLLQYEQSALKHQAALNKLLISALAVLVLGLAFMAYRSFIARQRFKALAEYDDLTAISNRYHFSTSAKGALALCEKGQLPAALIVFDLDHFKQINDQYGHAAGDWALRQTVDTCRNFMRNNDVFGRIGGEEFAILLPGCQSDKAHLLADICRDAISNINTAASGFDFTLTASFGVTSAELSGYHLTKLIEDADAAMYQAKQQGRNKVYFFQG
jgi:diguanylate cyclase (GGDEF)-like protein